MTKQEHSLTYFVNGEAETTTSLELSVGTILESAGFAPKTNYTLKSENPPRDYGSSYDEVIKLHPNQRFQALFKGPTPTSDIGGAR